MKKGFTLLEILLVIAAIGILAAIVIVAINPNRQLAQVRNSTRYRDVGEISSALEQYLIDNGNYPAEVTDYYQPICTQEQIDLSDTANCANLSVLSPTYIASVPVDPSNVAYEVAVNPINNKVSVLATAELGETIEQNAFGAKGGQERVVDEDGTYYKLHSFTNIGSEDLEVFEDVTVEYLIVGGGGGSTLAESNPDGVGDGAGGGGGGGVLSGNLMLSAGTYSAVVGEGGFISNGSDSSFNGLTAIGGGRGGGFRNSGVTSGGSGGGAGGNCFQSNRTGGAGTPGQGFRGGNDLKLSGGCDYRGGRGGGGAGEAAPDGSSANGGPGGDGVLNDITGENIYYGGGGGGGSDGGYQGGDQGGLGGLGGGGNGSDGTNPAEDGEPNTGGGAGGGAAGLINGGTGGSGVVIIRYEL